MTDSKTPLTSEKKDASVDNVSSDKLTNKKSSPKKNDNKKSLASSSSNKISKLAIFAILVALAVPSGHFYWQQLQHQQLEQTLVSKVSSENNASLSRYQSQIQQALAQQKQNFDKQLQQVATQISSTSQAKITELNTKVLQLEQNIQQRQPSDWLLHEAEYLIRIAARTLWLEHDTSAAMGLLKDADSRLTELNDPAFLPVREVIYQDIKSLELMPTLETDEVILALMAMNKLVAQLPLAIVDLGKESDKETDFNLSDDINDWQTNLAKTWQKFLNDFIRVRQRAGSIEPLMSPAQQAHLKQNLSLKIQLALWAASERKGDIYLKALVDIEQWLNEFFAMEHSYNQRFKKALLSLQKQRISYDYPSELSSLKAIRSALRNQPKMQKSKTDTASQKPVQRPKLPDDKPKNEGSI